MIDKSWFDCLTTAGLQEHHAWLANLPSAIRRIANFGYWSGGEPFALLWTLDAIEITVIEKNAEYIENLHQETAQVSHRYPDSLRGRTINPFCRGMTETIPELPNQYYDLTFCENVLYNLQEGQDLLEYAILQMIRITKLGGYVIAVEPKYGVNFEWQESDFFGMKMQTPIPLDEPKDMSQLFDSKGLERIEVEMQPAFAYCFRRIH